MSKVDVEFHKLCNEILSNGREYENKNRGAKRLQIPSYTFRHNMADGFPALTNKKLYWRGIVTELIWFLRGDNDVEFLNKNGVTIWNKDAYNWHKKKWAHEPSEILTEEVFNAEGKGSVGQNYSVQWRNFNGTTDQIANLLSDMVKDIMSSRLKVNAWNPAETELTALPPCHSEFQVIGVPLENGTFGFELHWNQRSVDTFLGLPFNIASYGLLAMILESITGYKALAIEGTLKCVHFYDNQYDAVKELLSRDPNKHSNCELAFDRPEKVYDSIDDLFNALEPRMFELVGYTSDDAIKVDMLAPKGLS